MSVCACVVSAYACVCVCVCVSNHLIFTNVMCLSLRLHQTIEPAYKTAHQRHSSTSCSFVSEEMTGSVSAASSADCSSSFLEERRDCVKNSVSWYRGMQVDMCVSVSTYAFECVCACVVSAYACVCVCVCGWLVLVSACDTIVLLLSLV